MHGLYKNGGGFATLTVADHLQSTARFDVSIMSYDGTTNTLPQSGARVLCPSLSGMRYLPRAAQPAFRHWRRTAALARAITQADLVVASDHCGPTLVDSLRFARSAEIPACCIVHIDLESKFASEDHDGNSTREETLLEYRMVDRIICVSEGIRESLVRDLPEKARDIIAIPNGVDLERIDRLVRLDPEQGPLPAEPFFLGVGRLDHAKGFDLLIEAHARLRATGAPAHKLVILGEGRLQERLQAQAITLGVADSVIFLGFVANPFPIMARAFALCTSSRFEGYSLATAEAAALGTPVISTACPHGPSEILEGGRYGALVAPNDTEALANAMRAHLAQPADLRERAAASWQDRDRLSHRHALTRYEAIFDGLVDRPTAPRPGDETSDQLHTLLGDMIPAAHA